MMRFALFLVFALICHSVNAQSTTQSYSRADLFNKIKDAVKNPAKARKILNPYGLLGQLAFDSLLDGIDKISQDAQNPTWIDEKTKQNTNQSTQNTQTKAQGDWDYLFDDKLFSSPEAVKAYIINEHMPKHNFKFTRKADGYYYQYWVVNYQQRTMRLYAQVAKSDDVNCAKYNDRCGFETSFTGGMVPIGSINNTTTINTKDVARDIAVNTVINDALDRYEQELEKEGIKAGAITTPQPKDKDETKDQDAVKPKPIPSPSDTTDTKDETKDKPKTGTGTRAGSGTADSTQAGTKDETATENGTSTKKDEKDKDKEKDKELPKFCEYAKTVCDFIDWMKEPPPSDEPPKQVPKATISDVGDLGSVDRYRQRINFDGQCPTGTLSFEVKSVAYSYQIPYHHFCSLLEQLRPWLLAFTYLSTAFFVVRSL